MLTLLLFMCLLSTAAAANCESPLTRDEDTLYLLQTTLGKVHRGSPDPGVGAWLLRNSDMGFTDMMSLTDEQGLDVGSEGWKDIMSIPDTAITSQDVTIFNQMQKSLPAFRQERPGSFSQSLLEESDRQLVQEDAGASFPTVWEIGGPAISLMLMVLFLVMGVIIYRSQPDPAEVINRYEAAREKRAEEADSRADSERKDMFQYQRFLEEQEHRAALGRRQKNTPGEQRTCPPCSSRSEPSFLRSPSSLNKGDRVLYHGERATVVDTDKMAIQKDGSANAMIISDPENLVHEAGIA